MIHKDAIQPFLHFNSAPASCSYIKLSEVRRRRELARQLATHRTAGTEYQHRHIRLILNILADGSSRAEVLAGMFNSTYRE